MGRGFVGKEKVLPAGYGPQKEVCAGSWWRNMDGGGGAMCIGWGGWNRIALLVWDTTNNVMPPGEQAEARRLNTSRLLPDVVTYTTLLKVRGGGHGGGDNIHRICSTITNDMCEVQSGLLSCCSRGATCQQEPQRISQISRPSPRLPNKDTDTDTLAQARVAMKIRIENIR